MNKAALVTQITSMIAENPVEITCAGETHDGGVGNMNVLERQMAVGRFPSYMRSVWIILDEWTAPPENKDTVTIGGTTFRVLDYKDYYLDTARRLDLGSQYEHRRFQRT